MYMQVRNEEALIFYNCLLINFNHIQEYLEQLFFFAVNGIDFETARSFSSSHSELKLLGGYVSTSLTEYSNINDYVGSDKLISSPVNSLMVEIENSIRGGSTKETGNKMFLGSIKLYAPIEYNNLYFYYKSEKTQYFAEVIRVHKDVNREVCGIK